MHRRRLEAKEIEEIFKLMKLSNEIDREKILSLGFEHSEIEPKPSQRINLDSVTK